MKYGISVSKDSFVFTRNGIVAVGQLPVRSEILGVQGIGKNATYEKVTFHHDNNPVVGFRLFTQCTDSVLLPQTCLFSERVVEAKRLTSASEVEFFHSFEVLKLDHNPVEKTDLDSESMYCLGLLSSKIIENERCSVFLVRGATEKSYVRNLEETVASFSILNENKGKVTLKTGKLGHLWIIINGKGINGIQRKIDNFSPERICMKVTPTQLKNYVAGMLDTYICKPFFGRDSVLRFFSKESFQKRFLHNALALYGYRIYETSCITNHAPRFLESKALVGTRIPLKNPLWESTLEASKEGSSLPKLFSRIRGTMDAETTISNIIFQKHGFSPIIDGLYAYPQLLSD
jgi:hypothetical protein